MSDPSTRAPSDAGDVSAPANWTITDLREHLDRLQVQLGDVQGRASEHVRQLKDWASTLPTHHQPKPDPVRLADLASTERVSPLSLARRVADLSRLLERIDELSRTLTPTAADETGVFAPDSPTPSIDDGNELVDVREGETTRVSIIGHCHSSWDDDQSFERQRQAIRKVLNFDGNRTWYGTVARSINDDLMGWNSLLTAAEAGAHIEIHLP